MNQLSTIQIFAIWVLPVLFAITVHEVAHGWMASKLGDKTALIMGRVTLNPLKHIDLIGTIIVPAALLLLNSSFIFGWAKPVPVNFANLKKPRRDMALVAAAGPASNLIMAVLWALIARLGVMLLHDHQFWAMSIAYMGQAGILINMVLMVLNLIPIPPLDGSRIVTSFLSPRAAVKYNSLERYGFIIILILLATGILGRVFFPIAMMLSHLLATITGL